MPFSIADIRRIAWLARIDLSGTDADRAVHDLDGIFGVIEALRAVDTTGVAPLTTPLNAIHDVALRLRDDVVTEVDRRADYQAPAPSVEDGLYLVPKVIE